MASKGRSTARKMSCLRLRRCQGVHEVVAVVPHLGFGAAQLVKSMKKAEVVLDRLA